MFAYFVFASRAQELEERIRIKIRRWKERN